MSFSKGVGTVIVSNSQPDPRTGFTRTWTVKNARLFIYRTDPATGLFSTTAYESYSGQVAPAPNQGPHPTRFTVTYIKHLNGQDNKVFTSGEYVKLKVVVDITDGQANGPDTEFITYANANL